MYYFALFLGRKQFVAWIHVVKNTIEMLWSTETMLQGFYGKQTLDVSTESSPGKSTVYGTTCYNHLQAAQTKEFSVN